MVDVYVPWRFLLDVEDLFRGKGYPRLTSTDLQAGLFTRICRARDMAGRHFPAMQLVSYMTWQVDDVARLENCSNIVVV